jgi:hypothetical protein
MPLSVRGTGWGIAMRYSNSSPCLKGIVPCGRCRVKPGVRERVFDFWSAEQTGEPVGPPVPLSPSGFWTDCLSKGSGSIMQSRISEGSAASQTTGSLRLLCTAHDRTVCRFRYQRPIIRRFLLYAAADAPGCAWTAQNLLPCRCVFLSLPYCPGASEVDARTREPKTGLLQWDLPLCERRSGVPAGAPHRTTLRSNPNLDDIVPGFGYLVKRNVPVAGSSHTI